MNLREIDDALIAKGWPPVSPYWWGVLEEVYASMIRNIVACIGRRGGKSSTICGRVAPYELLSDRHVVPPGDIGYFAILSADKDQAQERLDTCSKALTDLGIPEGRGPGQHRKTANEITLNDRNVGIKCFAATRSAVVSFTCIGYLADEMARWRDKDTGENPAKEIVTSLRATMLTMPNARGWHVSAPWSTIDLHHEMVEQGSNESQLVFCATTPEANPTLTDAMIIALEPDQPSRDREYYIIPMSSDETKWFSADHIKDAAKPKAIGGAPDKVRAGADFAFRRNSSAMVTLQSFGETFRLVSCEERVPGAKALVPSKTIKDLCGIAENFGADGVAADLHYIESVREHIDDLSIELLEFPIDSDNIGKAYVRTRVALAEGRLDLSLASPRLVAQLKETTGQPTADGGITIRNKSMGAAHGDLVSALVCAVWASDQIVPGHKIGVGERRYGRSEDASQGFSDLPNYQDD